MGISKERIKQINEVFNLLDQNSKEYECILGKSPDLNLYKPNVSYPQVETGNSCLSREERENARLEPDIRRDK